MSRIIVDVMPKTEIPVRRARSSSESLRKDDEVTFAAMANAVNPYGDGLSSGRCVDAMVKLLGS